MAFGLESKSFSLLGKNLVTNMNKSYSIKKIRRIKQGLNLSLDITRSINNLPKIGKLIYCYQGEPIKLVKSINFNHKR